MMRSMVAIVAVFSALSAVAQVPLPVEKEPHHKTVFSNEALRILDVHVPMGAITLDHVHSHDLATVCIECADNTQTRSPGEDWSGLRARQIGSPAVNDYTGIPSTHAVRNVGPGAYRLVGVENLRPRDWSTGKALAAPATTLSLESRSFRLYDVRLVSGRATTAHIHTVPTVVTLVAGSVIATGGSESQSLKQPGQWTVIAPGQAHALTTTGVAGAHLVEIEVR